jgi:delta 1-pyrroline-5-carboxylate dehydrogenase
VRLNSLAELPEEVFGPIVQIIRYKQGGIDDVIQHINATGYGLTFGLHTRIMSRAQKVAAAIRAGNVYVNRSMIGAVVGVQPFGGEGLSGTGPKAGGPNYLRRFCTEQTVTINTTASGGNVALLTGVSDDI